MTNPLKFNNPPSGPRVLVAPLDWGLGHATRCIPIIYALLDEDCEVFLCGDGATGLLLRKEFPALQFLPIINYKVRYSRYKKFLPLKLLIQLPRVLLTIYKEHTWLKRVVKTYKLDGIISDNRFGLYHKTTRSIYVTHQLLIKTSSRFTERIAQKIHYFFIRKYSKCWIPDALQDGIAGELSHPKSQPANIEYIGPLSRFEDLPGIQKKYDLLITISGPEPQRTIFEKILINDLTSYKGKAIFVRGLPGNTNSDISINENIEVVNHLSSKELNIAMLQSDLVIGRSGYTTIMDLLKLHKNAVLVPTQGQSEQEYLAEYLSRKKIFYSETQDKFSLKDVLEKVASFPFFNPSLDMMQYKMAVNEFVKEIKKEMTRSLK